MAKIVNDKYYTPIELANKCIDKVLEVIGYDNISEVVEPSIGNGSFTHHDKLMVHFGYDIEPESGSSELTTVIKGDFLKQDISYLPGRLVIGNPPFGDRCGLAQKFFKKSVGIGDYVAFILPISQMNNTNTFYEFDLIYSEDLGEYDYSGRPLRCCFNIYRRPESMSLNKKKKDLNIQGVHFYRSDSKDYRDVKVYDLKMCCWGCGSIGTILYDDSKIYAAEYKVYVEDSNPQKDDILNIFKTYDWKKHCENVNISAYKLTKKAIIEVLLSNGIQQSYERFDRFNFLEDNN